MNDKTNRSELSFGARILRIVGFAALGALATLALRYFWLTTANNLGWTPNPLLVDTATVGLIVWFGSLALSRYQFPKDQPIPAPIATSGRSTIAVFRPSTHVDSLRLHKVFIDDQPVATLADGRRVTIQVAPGQHTLRAEIDWCHSNILTFDIRRGERLTFRLAPTATGLLMPLVLVLFFMPRFWMRITRIHDASRPSELVGTGD